MNVPEKGSKGVFLLNRSLREHFRGLPDDSRGPEMNNRSAVELFRGLREVSKGLKRIRKGSERYRKGSKGLSRGRNVFRGQKTSFDGANPRVLRRIDRVRQFALRTHAPRPAPFQYNRAPCRQSTNRVSGTNSRARLPPGPSRRGRT